MTLVPDKKIELESNRNRRVCCFEKLLGNYCVSICKKKLDFKNMIYDIKAFANYFKYFREKQTYGCEQVARIMTHQIHQVVNESFST